MGGRQQAGQGGNDSGMLRDLFGVRPILVDRFLAFGAFMTTSEHTPAPETVNDAASENENKAEIPAFSFPFKPGELLQAKKDQGWYQKGGKSNHEKRPGAAPAGTRRSMGKR
jgi:hypothetical protein